MRKQLDLHDNPSSVEQVSVTEMIEQYAYDRSLTIMDAIGELAKENGWEMEWFAPYVTGSLKEKLRTEGEALGLLKHTSRPAHLFT